MSTPPTPSQVICDDLQKHIQAVDMAMNHVAALRLRKKIDPELSAAIFAAKDAVDRATSALWTVLYRVDPRCDWCGKRVAQQGQKHPECLREESLADEAEDRQITEMEERKERLWADQGHFG